MILLASGRENGDYKARVQIMNVSIKMLDAAWQEWSAASRRQPCAPLAAALKRLLRQARADVRGEAPAKAQG